MASHTASLQNFDPSGVGQENGNFCGLPFTEDSAGILLLGMPWEVTVSYQAGTAAGPEAVRRASPQLDLYDLDSPDGWRQGIYMPPLPEWIVQRNAALRPLAAQVIKATEQGVVVARDPQLSQALAAVNQGCEAVNQWLYERAQAALAQGKRVATLGGDHSTPLGLIRAIADKFPDFGILQIDAHADLRDAYQGFQYSHASIMTNVLTLPQISQLVQVGVRDISQQEVTKIHQSRGRILTYYDAVLKQKQYAGANWLDLCQQIVDSLPQQVYVSFDVDGLDPKLCPHTGTPVPGGLELEQAFCLLRCLVERDRKIIGFDVSEVGAGEWDGNVGARIVYKLCNLMGLSQQQS